MPDDDFYSCLSGDQLLTEDAPTEYLNEFRGEWVGWEAGAANDDTLDATWGMMYAGQENLAPEYFGGENPIPVQVVEEVNPFNADWSTSW